MCFSSVFFVKLAVGWPFQTEHFLPSTLRHVSDGVFVPIPTMSAPHRITFIFSGWISVLSYTRTSLLSRHAFPPAEASTLRREKTVGSPGSNAKYHVCNYSQVQALREWNIDKYCEAGLPNPWRSHLASENSKDGCLTTYVLLHNRFPKQQYYSTCKSQDKKMAHYMRMQKLHVTGLLQS